MLSSVLISKQAVRVNVEIMRILVRLRKLLADNVELARRLDELEKPFRKHGEQFAVVFDAIRKLMTPPTPQQREMGYHTLVRGAD